MNIYEKVIDDLKSASDAKYKSFNDKIAMTKLQTLGVRVPDIKRIVKSVPKEEIENYLADCEFCFYEDTLVYGLLLARLDFETLWKRKDEYLSRCDSWGLIDCFVPSIKVGRSEKEIFYRNVMNEITEKSDFFLRFDIVALLDFFVGGEHTSEILRTVEKLDGRGYYNDMAIAWLVSVAFVKGREETLEFLKNNSLGVFTHNKAISKINDSLRVSDSDKKYLKTIRK